MKKIVIEGGHQLSGMVDISGAKNAAVAIIPAAVLSDGVCRIENVPNISDIASICDILRGMGVDIKFLGENAIEIDASGIKSPVAIDDKVRKMRASYYLLGSLLGKFNESKVLFPGGCDFGSVRPIDQHLKGFAALGAKYTIEDGVICLKSKKLVGSYIYLDVVSIGATINIMLAAVRTQGETIIENAAKEPHVVDLANFLNCMGADIRGAGTDVIKIRGVNHLSGCTYSIVPDQIEAGTYMAAVVATGGNVVINGIIPRHLEGISAKLEEMGAKISENSGGSLRIVKNPCESISKINIKTMPYPGFPTDLQPQFSTVLSLANGTSIVTETVWDNRFRYVEELRRMGAQISLEGKVAVIEGTTKLFGTTVKASDLRAGAALIIAGLAATGTTYVEKTHYIERGYENIVGKLSALGASISYSCPTENDDLESSEMVAQDLLA